MSFRYKVLERCIKAVDIKKIYSMPKDEMFNYLKEKHRADDVPDFLYKHLKVERINVDGRPVFKICSEKRTSSEVILFVHGGGGMMCPTLLHYRFAEKLVKNTGAALYFPFYPLGPEASAEESMQWLDGVYEKILEKHNPEHITVVGDSAGAALSVSIIRRTSQKPKGLVLISPSVGTNGNTEKMKAMEHKDVILSVRTIELVKKYWIGDKDIADDDFNMLKPDYAFFPPVQIYYGTNELFFPYIDELTETIKSSGTETYLFEGTGLCHDWVLIGAIPEGVKAVKSICEFITG